MKTTLGFYLLICAFLLVCFSAGEAQSKDEWVRIKSKNFNIVGNASDTQIRAVATKLEQFREVFRQLLPNLKFDSPVATTVIVFKNNSAFAPYKPVFDNNQPTEWISGYFLKGEDENYIAISTEGGIERSYESIFHEYTHFLVDNDIGRSKIPAWLNEGLAEYYEKFKIEDDQKVTLGAVNNQHLSLLAENSFTAPDIFFNTDYYSLNRQTKSGAGIFYAQSWALTHYLIQGENGARKKQLSEFINLLIGGKNAKEAFQEAFQTDYAKMLAEVKKYVLGQQFNVTTTVFKEKIVFNGQVSASPVSEAESEVLLGDLLYHSRRFDEAAQHFEKALLIDGNSSEAKMLLGLVKLSQNKLSEAKTLLKESIEQNDKNYLAHYQYAYVLSRENMTESGFVSGYDADTAETIKEELKTAIAQKPDFTESYALYAFVCAVRNEDVDEAIEFIKKALSIAPGNQKYLIRQSELLLRKQNFADARQIAQRVFETASDIQMRVYAQNTVARINSTEAQLKAIKNYKKKLHNDVESDEPISEEELARRNAVALNEGINQSLRRPKDAEKRVLGYITKIECQKQTIEFTVKIDDRIQTFYTTDFASLFLMSYSSDSAETQIGCGTIKKEVFAVLTFRPADNSNPNSAGDIISIEFVPKSFKLF
jgi:tetratricopeptide (TPR) repeat protein